MVRKPAITTEEETLTELRSLSAGRPDRIYCWRGKGYCRGDTRKTPDLGLEALCKKTGHMRRRGKAGLVGKEEATVSLAPIQPSKCWC